MSILPNDLNWNHLRAFLTTADAGSLSAAALQLGQTQPTLSRQVAALEAELDMLLFERIGKQLEVTQAGLDLLEHLRPMQAAAEQVALTASGQSQSIAGQVKITASDVFSAHRLPDVVHVLRHKAPDLQVEIIAANDIRDLMRREADIAIRHVQPEQPDLIARKLNDLPAHFYASHDYLAQHGTPLTLADMSRHDLISFGSAERMIEALAPLGMSVTERNFPCGSESGLVGWELAKRGLGIIPMSTILGDKSPEMVRVLPDAEPFMIPIWLVTHRELHSSRSIRLVFDTLAEFLSEN
ncbi:LysR family transcriptional regulator [Sedimentitalea sp. CY04]|uniref:LysR family transcriptional regulator n=1 Tax=Parasedimentitalea denitrificans TaxID=2211118 RepID=A0ABX0W6B5_9RHOB|nr:LysR family transcriptional regulator [Sedimentitalea sp. CY04]NIZ60966.1 LysR family transcriptional regulator [Sedimentitalea sp. CY04]